MRLFTFSIINDQNHEVHTSTAWADNIADAFAFAQEVAEKQWYNSRVSMVREEY
jgi:hypothetical protein